MSPNSALSGVVSPSLLGQPGQLHQAFTDLVGQTPGQYRSAARADHD
ncbi:hypothetical protein [Streptomyces sp. NPDC004976]